MRGHQRQVVIGVLIKPGRKAIVVDLGAGADGQLAESLVILHRELLQVAGHVLDPGVGLMLQELPVHAVAPMQVIMVAQPGRYGRGKRVLYPSAHFGAIQGRHPGHRQAIGAEILFGVEFLVGFIFFQVVDISLGFFQVIAAIAGPIA